MASSIQGNQGVSSLPRGETAQTDDLVVTYQNRSVRVVDPDLKARLMEMIMQDASPPSVAEQPFKGRAIAEADTTCLLKTESDVAPRTPVGRETGVGSDEDYLDDLDDLDDSDTLSVADDSEDYRTTTARDNKRIDSRFDDGVDDFDDGIDDFDKDVDANRSKSGLENADDEKGAKRSSVRQRFSSAAQRIKSFGKRIKDRVTSLPGRIKSKMPKMPRSKTAARIARHLPSPTALKNRVASKVAQSSTYRSLKKHSSHASHKTKMVKTRIKSKAAVLSGRIKSKIQMPRKIADAFRLRAPSPKVLKERIIRKVDYSSARIQDLRTQARDGFHQLSKPGGPSSYAEDDQLTAVRENLANTEVKLERLYQQRDEILQNFEDDDALVRWNETEQSISELSSDLKSYQLAEKTLQKMMKPAARQMYKDLRAQERAEHSAASAEFKQQSASLAHQLGSLQRGYAKLKAALAQPIQKLEDKITEKEGEIAKLESRLSHPDTEGASEDQAVYLGGIAMEPDYIESLIESKQKELEAMQEKLGKIQENILAKKEEIADVKAEQADLKREMRKERSAFERSMHWLKKEDK